MRRRNPAFFTLLVLLAPLALGPAAQASHQPLVCVYYYPWYGGPDHPWVNVTDTPVLGFYNSSHLAVIARHLAWLSGLGVDCLFISWWGPGHYTDRVAQEIFGLLPEYGLKAAILVEPYLGQDPGLYNASWWNQTLAYLRESYIDRHPDAYLRVDGKPLILAFNPIGLNYNSTMLARDFPGYTVRIVGNDIDNAGYQDWDYWPDYDTGLTGELRVRRDGYVALAPRFDDEHFRPGGTPPYDPDLSRGWYEKQWRWVLRNRARIRIVAVTSWNEFHERTAIEPANDGKAPRNPYQLYDTTKRYIALLKARTPPQALGGIAVAVVAGLALTTAVVLGLTRIARL